MREHTYTVGRQWSLIALLMLLATNLLSSSATAGPSDDATTEAARRKDARALLESSSAASERDYAETIDDLLTVAEAASYPDSSLRLAAWLTMVWLTDDSVKECSPVHNAFARWVQLVAETDLKFPKRHSWRPGVPPGVDAEAVTRLQTVDFARTLVTCTNAAIGSVLWLEEVAYAEAAKRNRWTAYADAARLLQSMSGDDDGLQLADHALARALNRLRYDYLTRVHRQLSRAIEDYQEAKGQRPQLSTDHDLSDLLISVQAHVPKTGRAIVWGEVPRLLTLVEYSSVSGYVELALTDNLNEAAAE